MTPKTGSTDKGYGDFFRGTADHRDVRKAATGNVTKAEKKYDSTHVDPIGPGGSITSGAP
jgi:hypothetical protein